MNYKKGDKVRVKKGCGKRCQAFFELFEPDYLVITYDDTYYAYNIYKKDGKLLDHCACFTDEHLEPLTKDFSTIDTGDVIVSQNNKEFRIIGRAGEMIFFEDDEGYSSSFSEKEFKRNGYTIKQPSTEPLELSVEEISKRLGYEVKIIKK